MASGFVLDFSDRSFSEFFKDTANIDIYSEKYSSNGTSKAKHLRAFWDKENDILVGKVLLGLLDIWDYLNINKQEKKEIFLKIQQIAFRLLGQSIPEDASEDNFLSIDFSTYNITSLDIEAPLIPIFESRIEEAQKCLNSGAYLSVVILCGSILEALLLGLALKKPSEYTQSTSAPKNAGKVLPIPDWKLCSLIDVSYDLGFIDLTVKKYTHSLREFRNFIHPYEQLSSQFIPDKYTASISLQVLRAAIASLIKKL